MKRYSFFAMLLMGCFLCLFTRSWAADSGETSGVLSLEDLLKADVVQGASKYAQTSSEAPASTEILTARDIRAHGWRTLEELLNSVKSFYFTNDRYYNYVGVRGFGPMGDYNTNVLVTIDGHRLNENIFDSVGYGMDFPLDMEQVDHVEIIMGPGSSLYGDNAVFAVVNVYTKKPKGPYSGQAIGELESLGTSRAYMGLQNGDSPIAWAASGSAFYSRGNAALYFPELDSPDTNNGVAENADGERQRRAYGTATWGPWTLQGLYNHRMRDYPTGAFDTDFNNTGNFIVDQRGYLDLSYAGNTEKETYFNGRAYVDNYIYTGDYITGGLTNRDDSEGDWFGGEAQIVTHKLPHQTLIAGLEGRHNVHQYQANFDVDGYVYLNEDRQADQWAAFVQDEISIARHLYGYLGLRYDDPYYIKGTFMPRAALVYEMDHRTTLKAMYGESYRAPNQYEMFYVDNITYEAPGPLKAETIDTYELNFKRVLSPGFSAELSGFIYKVHDLLFFDVDSEITGAGRTVNLDDASTRGLEPSLQYRSANGTVLRASYSYLDTYSSLTGGVMDNAPRHLGKMDGIIPLMGEKILGALEWQGMTNRVSSSGAWVGGYGILSANLSSRDWPVKGVGVDFGVRNICDRKYLDPVADNQSQDTIAENGRTFRLKVSTSF